jgi:hypothetical protein
MHPCMWTEAFLKQRNADYRRPRRATETLTKRRRRDIWPDGAFTNTGAVTNCGEFVVRYEDGYGDADEGQFSRLKTV